MGFKRYIKLLWITSKIWKLKLPHPWVTGQNSSVYPAYSGLHLWNFKDSMHRTWDIKKKQKIQSYGVFCTPFMSKERVAINTFCWSKSMIRISHESENLLTYFINWILFMCSVHLMFSTKSKINRIAIHVWWELIFIFNWGEIRQMSCLISSFVCKCFLWFFKWRRTWLVRKGFGI